MSHSWKGSLFGQGPVVFVPAQCHFANLHIAAVHTSAPLGNQSCFCLITFFPFSFLYILRGCSKWL